ncbi:MAG: flagellar motor switch protein FliG [Candidatus Glassbacteria bacterium]|nr:flagellar motor switch protein FliG [Candidatus Glassbacteria bacterium]
MAELAYESLTGLQKAAILVVALGVEASSPIFKNMSESDIQQLTIQIANIEEIPSVVTDAVVEEFYQMVLAQEYVGQGGLEYARSVLEQSLGEPRAAQVLSKVQGALHVSGFKLLKKVDPAQLLNFILHEHPQTVAVIMAQIEPEQAASILAELPEQLQNEIVYRVATMGKISPELLNDVEKTLESQMESVLGQDFSQAGGANTVAEILNLADRNTERKILDTLVQKDPELATEVKNLMFVFDDLMLLDDKSLQRVMKEIDVKDLSMALKGTGEELKDKCFNNVSERVATLIQEEMDFMGPVRLRDVEEVQQRIVDVVRSLEEDGEIVVSGKGGAEDALVE